MSQSSNQTSSDTTSGAPSRPSVSTTGSTSGASFSSMPPPPSPLSNVPPPSPSANMPPSSPSSNMPLLSSKPRRHSVSGPAQIMGQRVLDMNCDVPSRSILETCEKSDIIQALMNASNWYQNCAAVVEAKGEGMRSVLMKQAAEKWTFIGATEGEQMELKTQDRLIGALIECLEDVRCIKSHRIDLIHQTIRDLD